MYIFAVHQIAHTTMPLPTAAFHGSSQRAQAAPPSLATADRSFPIGYSAQPSIL